MEILLLYQECWFESGWGQKYLLTLYIVACLQHDFETNYFTIKFYCLLNDLISFSRVLKTSPDTAVKWVAILSYILKVLGSNLGPATGYTNR